MKGFTMDNERLKNPPGQGQKDYFDELLARIPLSLNESIVEDAAREWFWE